MGLAHEKGKSHLSFLVSQDHCIECQEVVERNQEGFILQLCSLRGVHRFPSWSVGLRPERPRWGYNHCSVAMGLDQQGGLIIKQPCLYGHFPLGNCPENTNLLHRKYQLGVYHHPWAQYAYLSVN